MTGGPRANGAGSPRSVGCYGFIFTPKVMTTLCPGVSVPTVNVNAPVAPLAGVLATVPIVVAAGTVAS